MENGERKQEIHSEIRGREKGGNKLDFGNMRKGKGGKGARFGNLGKREGGKRSSIRKDGEGKRAEWYWVSVLFGGCIESGLGDKSASM